MAQTTTTQTKDRKAGRPVGAEANPRRRFHDRANVTYRLLLSAARKCEGMQGSYSPSAEERAKVAAALLPVLERATNALRAFQSPPPPGSEAKPQAKGAQIFGAE